METRQKLEASLKEAIRSNNELRKRTIRLALAAIKQAEIDGGKILEDSLQLALLQKEVKTREESVEAARKGNREDLIAVGLAEIDVLKEFMPKQLDDDEITRLAIEAIDVTNATKPADMGKVMKHILPQVAGKASNSAISEIVKKLLNEK